MKNIICIILSLLIASTALSFAVPAMLESFEYDESEYKNNQDNQDNQESLTEIVINPDKTNKATENKKDSSTTSSTASSLKVTNNGIIKKATVKTIDIFTNFKLLKTSKAQPGNLKTVKANAVFYEFDGEVVNWTTENDIIYVITSNNNRLVMINSKNMSPIYSTPLSAIPAEINIVDDKIYISLPALRRIDIFSKTTCQKESSISFDHQVSSFCIDGKYIYYSEHDQHCMVFKKDLESNNTKALLTKNGAYASFYFPKLYLNKEDRILYIGETHTSSSGIHYYDADTLQHKKSFEAGIFNNTREIFHVNDKIYWGNFCLSDTDANELIGVYGPSEYGGVLYASSKLVATRDGMFLTDTYEYIIDYQNTKFDFDNVIITQSQSFFFTNSTYNKNTIAGINFDLQ